MDILINWYEYVIYLTNANTWDTTFMILLFSFSWQPCLPDHQYSSTTVNDNQFGPETVDTGMQTDNWVEEMAEFMELKKRFENPDAIMRDVFIEKVTASDNSVKQ